MHGYRRSESGKHRAEVGSTRWVYNTFLRTRTKLRWVCGLCNVWCKDENGFKCHLEHESHIRKSELARQSAGREFKMTARDEAFAHRFVTYIAQNYLNQKVLLHQIYSELYPKDAKHQLLIKETCWGTLGVFINALSKAGEIEAYREVKGWVVRVGQDMLIAAEKEADARELGDKDFTATEAPSGAAWEDYTLLPRPAPDEEPSCLLAHREAPSRVEVPQPRVDRMQASWAKLRDGVVPMRAKSPPRPDDGGAARAAAQVWKAACQHHEKGHGMGSKRLDDRLVSFALPGKRQRKEQEQAMDTQAGQWPPGLVVKVLCPHALSGRAHMAKAVTLEQEKQAVESVRLRLLLDGFQETFSARPQDLQTVLPKLGGKVRILQAGPHRLKDAKLRSLETDSFSCTVDLDSGGTLAGLPYESVSKIWVGAQ